MRNLGTSIPAIMFAPEGDIPAGGSGDPGGAPAITPSGGGQQPVAGAPPAAPAEKVFTYKEDRTDWMPRHRYNEASTKLTAAEQRVAAAEARAVENERKLHAALGITPQDPKAKEQADIRAALEEMYPHLKQGSNLSAEEIQDLRDAAAAAKSTAQATWARHATTMLTDLESEISDSLGVDKLSATQQKNLRRAYREEVNEALAARDVAMRRGERDSLDSTPADNDALARHERGDKSLLKEFAKAFLADWYEPARRQVTAQAARRQMRPVPKGERTRTALATGAPQIDYNDSNAFKKALLEARSGGGQ